MSSIGSPSPFFFGGKKAYSVDRSLRFNNDDNTRLVRTIGSTSNRRTFTYSFWIKRSIKDAEQYVLFNGHSSSAPYFDARFVANSHTFEIGEWTGSAFGMRLITNRVFRDAGAWYHFVIAIDTTQSTSSNRAKLYINGVQETSFGTESYPSQNYDTGANVSGYMQVMGTHKEYTSNDLDGYLAEVNFIDGLALDSSYFGETDATTGQWNPKKYVGSYGTNGFYLNFSDNSGTTATTLGKDSSGNGNNFTPNNFSVSAGTGNDSVADSPTNNFCTFNPLKVNASNPIVFSNGALQHNGVSGDNHLRSSSTMQVKSGKWYVEFKFVSGYEATNGTVSFGLTTDAAKTRASNNDAFWYQNTDDFLAIAYRNSGKIQVFLEGSSQYQLTGLSTFVNGDVMGLAVDLDNDKLFVSKNGTFFSNGTGTQDPADGSNPVYSGGYLTSRKADGFYFSVDGYSAQVVTADFGQQGYAYTPPTGFKKVNSANLPDPTILLPNKHFAAFTYTGTGSYGTDYTFTNSDVHFTPDLVWIKGRPVSQPHTLSDSVRGVAKQLDSASTAAETTNAHRVNSFIEGGFTSGTDGYTNWAGRTFVAWNWNAGGSTASNSDGSITSSVRANTSAGFSIVTYTGTGSSTTVGHGLGVKPDAIIIKRRDAADNWMVYHNQANGGSSPEDYYFELNANGAAINSTVMLNDTAPTSSVVTIGSDNSVNGSSATYVMYCFSEVAGYSKFGSYTGNGNSDGTFVFTGFKPALVIVKNTNTVKHWGIFDNKRIGFNVENYALFPSTSDAEDTDDYIDFLSNGFKLRSTAQFLNKSGDSIIYLAFAESPFKNARAR